VLVTEDQRVPDLSAPLFHPIAKVLVEGDAVPEGPTGLVPPGKTAVGVGQAVERPGDRPVVAFFAEHRERVRERVDRVGEAALVTVGVAEVPHGSRPASLVAVVGEDAGGLGQQGYCLVVTAQLTVQGAQAAQSPGLGGQVRAVAGCVEGELVGALP
jgi:hypothetical protein